VTALQPYHPVMLTPPAIDALSAAARVALAYGRLHAGEGARWAEVLFGVGGAVVGPCEAVAGTNRGDL
jgi:hypothetical protein